MKTNERGQQDQKKQQTTEQGKGQNPQGFKQNQGTQQDKQRQGEQTPDQRQEGQLKGQGGGPKQKENAYQQGAEAKKPAGVQGQGTEKAQGKTPQSQQDAELERKRREERDTQANKGGKGNADTGVNDDDDITVNRKQEFPGAKSQTGKSREENVDQDEEIDEIGRVEEEDGDVVDTEFPEALPTRVPNGQTQH